jgi:hypothetical protein
MPLSILDPSARVRCGSPWTTRTPNGVSRPPIALSACKTVPTRLGTLRLREDPPRSAGSFVSVKTLSRVGWAPGSRVGREPRQGREGIPEVTRSPRSCRNPMATLGTPRVTIVYLSAVAATGRLPSETRTTSMVPSPRLDKQAGVRPRRRSFQPLPEPRPASDRLTASNRDPDRPALTDDHAEPPASGRAHLE